MSDFVTKRYLSVALLSTCLIVALHAAEENNSHDNRHENLNSVPSLHTVTECEPGFAITCWASCSFALNRWGNGDLNSYIYCQWSPPPEFMLHKHKAHLKDGGYVHNYCSADVTCNEEGLCYSYIETNTTECQFIAKTTNVRFTISITSHDDVDICGATSTFNPFSIVRIDKPQIEEISVDENLAIQIQMKKPECIAASWCTIQYRLLYSSSDGITKHDTGLQNSHSAFHLQLQEAQEYNFTIIAAIDEVSEILRLWSKPVYANYLAAPSSATDLSYVDIGICEDVGGYMFSATVQWQKTGIVNNFTLTITDDNDNKFVYNISKLKQDQQFFKFKLLSLNQNSTYKLALTALNNQGSSKPFLKSFDHTACSRKGKEISTCKTIASGESWTQLTWTKPTGKDVYTNFRISTTWAKSTKMTNKLAFNVNDYNITELQPCILYTHTIQSLYGDMVINSCRLRSHTLGPEPQISLQIKAKDVTSSSATFYTRIDENLLCGAITKFVVRYWLPQRSQKDNYSIEIPAPAHQVSLQNLEADTQYSMAIAACNGVGMGPFSEVLSFQTKSSILSTAPQLSEVRKTADGQYFIQWKQLVSNIINASYTVKIKTSRQMVAKEFTCPDQHRHECYFHSTQHNATLPFPSDSTIQLRACTDIGTWCSDWSQEVNVETSSYVPIALIVSLSTLLVVFISLVFIYFFCLRKCKDPIKGLKQSNNLLPDDILKPSLEAKSQNEELYEPNEEYELISFRLSDQNQQLNGLVTSIQLETTYKMKQNMDESTSDLGNEATCSIETQSSSHVSNGDLENCDEYVDFPSDLKNGKKLSTGGNSEENEFEFDIQPQFKEEELDKMCTCQTIGDSGVGSVCNHRNDNSNENSQATPNAKHIVYHSNLLQQYDFLSQKESLL